MTVTSALCPLSLQTLFDTEAVPMVAARLNFFAATTVTPIVVYQDANLSVAHPNPILTSGTGRVPPIYVGTAPYRVRIYDQFGQLIEDIDGIAGATVPSGGGGGGGTINPGDPTLIATGDMIASFSSALRAGFVRANGNTIGNASSGASERANADCQNLFQWLWGQDASLMLPVIGGRGSSATGDWNANKQITLPDLRARALFGVDGMGAAASNRMAGGVFDDASTPAMLGGHGGRSTHTLLAAEIPAHNHGASGYSDSIGSHTHSGVTDTQGLHNHTVPQGGGGTSQAAGATVGTIPTVAAQTTSSDGYHTHNLSINAAGTHQHVLSVTIASTGGGGAHDQVPPFFAATVYIKL